MLFKCLIHLFGVTAIVTYFFFPLEHMCTFAFMHLIHLQNQFV